MNAPVLSSQMLPMCVYVHLGLLDPTAVSQYVVEGIMCLKVLPYMKLSALLHFVEDFYMTNMLLNS